MRTYSLRDAAILTGKPESYLRKLINQGKLTGIRVKKGTREVWRVSDSTIQAVIKGVRDDVDYPALHDQWVEEQANGIHTGKPMGKRSIEVNVYSLEKYWQCLTPLKPSVRDLTPENLQKALASITVDHENRNCHFTMKDNMYKAFRSFLRFAIRKGLKPEKDLHEASKMKPKRLYPPRKTVAYENQIEDLLRVNEDLRGRTSFDRDFMRIAIYLASHAGLRSAELLSLRLSDVDVRNGIIQVFGKGNKPRSVGMTPELQKEIQAWLSIRPPSSTDFFLIQKNGKPMPYRRLSRRVHVLSKKAGLDITMHGLRRSFATIMTSKGMPLPYIQDQLGHAHLQTTEGYIMTNRQHAIDWLRNLHHSPPQAPQNPVTKGTKGDNSHDLSDFLK